VERTVLRTIVAMWARSRVKRIDEVLSDSRRPVAIASAAGERLAGATGSRSRAVSGPASSMNERRPHLNHVPVHVVGAFLASRPCRSVAGATQQPRPHAQLGARRSPAKRPRCVAPRANACERPMRPSGAMFVGMTIDLGGALQAREAAMTA
jgi:hypothetical protein